jgi:hypothetical protein
MFEEHDLHRWVAAKDADQFGSAITPEADDAYGAP